MVKAFSFERGDPLALDEYVDYIQTNVDPDDADSLVASAQHLHRLSTNKNLLTGLILEPVKNLALHSQKGNVALDASFKLAETQNQRFLVRANIWKVPEERGGSTVHEKRLYSYEAPHDHNFDFLTVGFFGPGYETDIWEYDYRSDLAPGDDVDLRFQGRFRLGIGDVMLYEKSKDIHTQKAPDDLSISINLLVNGSDLAYRQQFYFDVERNRVADMVVGPTLRRKELLDIAGAMRLTGAIEPLMDIANSYPCERTRRSAIDNLVKIDPSLLSGFGSMTDHTGTPDTRATAVA